MILALLEPAAASVGGDALSKATTTLEVARQALVALSGSVTIYMNDGVSIDNVELNHPDQCLLVEPKDWHTMTFGPGSVLLVMSSHAYDRSEYIDTPYELRGDD